jgi:glycosyltransferase involved in cell wall biosynthesis
VQQVFPSLLLLIPAYNEEHRIEPVLRAYAEYFRKNYSGKFQLVAVLNGCRDDTLGVVERVAAEYGEVSAVVFEEPIGKGGALIEGLRLAPRADLIGYVDADGATEPPAFADLVRRSGEADCVIGSRWIPGAVLHQMQTGQRRLASRTFHAIIQRSAVEKIHSSLCIADMAFDINLLYILKREGFTVLEVPTEWTDKVGSKVALGKTSFTMLLSVIRLRWIYSPLAPLRKLFTPLENWLYRKLNAPPPNPDPQRKRRK